VLLLAVFGGGPLELAGLSQASIEDEVTKRVTKKCSWNFAMAYRACVCIEKLHFLFVAEFSMNSVHFSLSRKWIGSTYINFKENKASVFKLIIFGKRI